ncbi:MAG: hypothetical protein ACSLEZ_13675 [Thiobacillus sp.]|jgi:hypothetical protein|nr:hypothetical protein [Burkholderiaceae bacterium]
MTKPLLMAALAAALLIPLGAQAQAQTAPSPAARATPDIKNFDQQLAEAQTQMQRMQEQMDRLRQTQDPLERQKLLQDHYTTMQNAMHAMRGMWGPGTSGCCGGGTMHGPGMMMGGPGMMGWGHMQGYYSKLTPEQLRQRQYMMDQTMGMQQMMMDHMMWRQQWMGPPPAAGTTK